MTVDLPVVSPDFTSWFVFIDDAPFMSWSHKCRYVFVNTKIGKYLVRVVKAQTCCTGCGSNVQILSDYVGRDYSCGGYYMSFTPNPANEEITVELNTDNLADYKSGAPWTLEIYTPQQVLLKKYTGITDTKKVIRTGSFKPGIYYVRVVMGGRPYAGKFVIER